MTHLIRCFHFLGGIYFAILLITLTILFVAVGTFLESQMDSHLAAAQWVYENPLFIIILCLFFINIFFSALRRWPFKRKHLPFLMTHLGLLMIISGTIIKKQIGLQGQLSVWEGSANQHVLIPQTYAISVESKENTMHQAQKSLVPLSSFRQNIYHPFCFPEIKCKVLGYTPHAKEVFDSWIKGSHAYVAGFPPIPVNAWEANQNFPEGIVNSCNMDDTKQKWSLIAIRSSEVQEALKQAYLKNLTLKIRLKGNSDAGREIPLEKALEEPFCFASGNCTVQLNLSFPLSNQSEVPAIDIYWQGEKSVITEKLTIPLQGQDALVHRSHSKWVEFPFIVDLWRPNPSLCFVDDTNENTIFFAFDSYGRVYGENFNSSQFSSLIAYDQGFEGYGVQAIIPFPNYPTSRKDKEEAEQHQLNVQLEQALKHQPPLSPPLRFFERACQKCKLNFSKTFIEFLTAWHEDYGFLFHPASSLSPNLEMLLSQLDWNEIAANDQQAIQWTKLLLTQLETSYKQGNDPIEILTTHRWPFLTELKAEMEQQNKSALNMLSQQMSSLISYLPRQNFFFSFNTHEHAQLLSAYFRNYGIDYRALFPYRGNELEQFNLIETYLKSQSQNQNQEWRDHFIFETYLTHRILPQSIPHKLESQMPGLVLELEKGQKRQTMALAYDSSAMGLKWPIFNGQYVIRFQPQLIKLPHTIRLRQARQLMYPESQQVYSYESDILISEKGKEPLAETLSMNHVYETWDGYRFYLSGVGTAADGIKRIQLAVNHDPAKYFLTYPGGIFVFTGALLLFFVFPQFKINSTNSSN